MTSAPHVSRAPLFNIPQRGEQPTAFFKAMSEADNLVRELDDLRSRQCRIEELTATPSLAERMRAAADTLAEVSALYGYREPTHAPWDARGLRCEADALEKP